jgi:mannose-1-phosphate guanylyltransferase / mannose-6-phosphate isomerase
LFQQILLCATKIANQSIQSYPPIIVTNEEHRFLAGEQLRELHLQAHFILEPVGKNTAPALTMAALQISEKYADNIIMVMMPSDQTIQNEEIWLESIRNAIHQAHDNGIVTLGVPPTHPETGYGYIQKQDEQNHYRAFEVVKFTETIYITDF